MRYLAKFESKSLLTNEIENKNVSKKDLIIQNIFKTALKDGSISVGDDFTKDATEYHVYKDYYIYDGVIFTYSERPSGDWYHTEINKSSIKIGDLLEKIENEIEELEKAYNKLYKHGI